MSLRLVHQVSSTSSSAYFRSTLDLFSINLPLLAFTSSRLSSPMWPPITPPPAFEILHFQMKDYGIRLSSISHLAASRTPSVWTAYAQVWPTNSVSSQSIVSATAIPVRLPLRCLVISLIISLHCIILNNDANDNPLNRLCLSHSFVFV